MCRRFRTRFKAVMWCWWSLQKISVLQSFPANEVHRILGQRPSASVCTPALRTEIMNLRPKTKLRLLELLTIAIAAGGVLTFGVIFLLRRHEAHRLAYRDT